MASVADALEQERRERFYRRNVIEICDRSYSPLGLLRGWDELEYTERYCAVGTAKVDVPNNDHNRELVQAGGTAVVKLDGEVEFAGPLEFGEGLPMNGNTVVLKVDWSDGLEYLNREQALPDPSFVHGENQIFKFPKAYDARKGLTSSVIREYVDWNIGPRSLPFRQVPGFVMGVDPFAGVALEGEVLARFDNLLAWCSRLATTGGVQFWVDTFDRAHTFEVRQVQDLTADVVFSMRLHGLAQSSFAVTKPKATRLYVGGKGEEADREFAMCTSYPSLADEAVWGVVEAFRDDRSAEGMSLIEGGWRALAEMGAGVTASFTPTDGSLKYRRDYRLGDVVTGELRPGLTVQKPIREVTTTVSVRDGRRVVPVAGDYSGSETQSARTQASLNRMVANLNTRK